MFKVRLLSAESTVFDAMVDAAFFPGELGEFEVLDHHADMLSVLTGGTIRLRQGGSITEKKITSGIVKIKNGEATACVEL